MKSRSIWRFALIVAYNVFVPSFIAVVVFISLAGNDMVGWIPPALGLFYMLTAINVYSAAWRNGERDRNLVKFGHLTFQPLRGLWAGLLGESPIVIALIFWLAKGGAWYIYFTAAIVMPILSLVGYLCGHRLFRIIDKVLYRGKPRRGRKR
ncbi:hypothetical protein FACS1894217_06580 [Clostridia bacterium]|nr:hypothetical protein FACS1894217_06580 [Clostridia bacterium]